MTPPSTPNPGAPGDGAEREYDARSVPQDQGIAAPHAGRDAPYGPEQVQTDAVTMLDAAALGTHPLADTIPEMLRDEYVELVADIKAHGQREPVTVYEGKVLDGRHRARACGELGIKVKAITFVGTLDEAKALVLSLNVHRRHLTLEQKDLIKQKRQVIDAELQSNPAQSDRQIAAKAKVNKYHVAKARAEAEANGQIDHKPDRTEAGGRKARGRKPASTPSKAVCAADALISTNVALETPASTTQAHMATPDEVRAIIDQIKTSIADADLCRVAAAALTRVYDRSLSRSHRGGVKYDDVIANLAGVLGRRATALDKAAAQGTQT